MKPERALRQQKKNDASADALRQWFTERRWLKVFPVLNNSDVDAISLRVLEFLTEPEFVEECQHEGLQLTYYVEAQDGSRRLFNLPAELAAYQAVRHKKHMEAFVRTNKDLANGGKFNFGYDEAVAETNVAQMQFCKFLVENNVLDWVRRHKDAVFSIKSRCESKRKNNNDEPRRKRVRTVGVGILS